MSKMYTWILSDQPALCQDNRELPKRKLSDEFMSIL